MSSNERPTSIVGMGTNRQADDPEFEINEGWNFFQTWKQDDSVIDSETFCYDTQDLNQDGPYYFNIPRFPDQFLDPSSLRLNGKFKIVHKQGNVIQDKLPTFETDFDDLSKPTKVRLTGVNVSNADKEILKTKDISYFGKQNTFPLGTGADFTTIEWAQLVDVHDTVEKNTCAKVVPVNMMCQAMWKDIEVKMNGVVITKNANLEYAHKAMFETMLTYGPEALETHMQAEMWDPDDVEDIKRMYKTWKDKTTYAEKVAAYETKDKTYHQGTSFQRKRKKWAENNEVTFSMQLHTELNSISSFLPDDMPYTFKFVRNEPSFFLRAPSGLADLENYTIKFTELQLTGTFMKPSPSVLRDYKAFMAKYDCALKTVRTSILTNQISKGYKSFAFNNIFASDHLPDQIFMGLVDMDAKNGDITKDPFYFDHFDLTECRLQVNNTNLPIELLKPDFDTDQTYARTFRHLYENVSVKTNNAGLSITPERFRWGSTIFGWDLNHDGCAGAHANHSDMFGSASLHLLFKNPLPCNVCVIVAAVHRDFLTIDQFRRPDVITSYGIQQLYEQKVNRPAPT